MISASPDNPEPRTRAEIRTNYERLVHAYTPPLLSFLRRYLACPADGEDVAQEAFVRAYQKLDHFDERGVFSRWLFTIAGNLARDLLRKRHRQAFHADDLEMPGPAVNTVAPATDSAEDEAEALEREVTALPDDLRQPIVLHYQLDWPVADIARHLGIREGAVRTRLHRARKLLQERLTHPLSQ